jgi:hypothetical protein
MRRKARSSVGGRRAGAGRKPLAPGLKRGSLISIRVTLDLRAQISAAAVAAGLSLSDWMVAAAELAIAHAAPPRSSTS